MFKRKKKYRAVTSGCAVVAVIPSLSVMDELASVVLRSKADFRFERYTEASSMDSINKAVKEADIVIIETRFAQALSKVLITVSERTLQYDIPTYHVIYDSDHLVKLYPLLDDIYKKCHDSKVVHRPIQPVGSSDNPIIPTDPSVPYSPALNQSVITINAATEKLRDLKLQLKLSLSLGNTEMVKDLSLQLLALSRTEFKDKGDLHYLVGWMGDCAVELEKANLYESAEQVYIGALHIDSTHSGVHCQYSDFLLDRDRIDDAEAQFQLAKNCEEPAGQMEMLELKFALKANRLTDGLGERLRIEYESDKSSRKSLVGYLGYLQKAEVPVDEFRCVCMDAAQVNSCNELLAKRALGDYLANRDQDSEAIQLYEDILSRVDNEDRNDLMHNLASCHASRNNATDSEVAIEYWKKAYKAKKDDSSLRRAFGSFLTGQGETELALKVMTGQLID